MSAPTFIPYGDRCVCPACGSLLGSYGDRQQVCPSPQCASDGKILPGVDPSFLYRGRVLVFVPDPSAGVVAGCDQVGCIIAVPPEAVTSEVARRQAPVVVRGVCWPKDRKHFGELFDHHVHHVDGPLIQPPNSGWDPTRDLPVL